MPHKNLEPYGFPPLCPIPTPQHPPKPPCPPFPLLHRTPRPHHAVNPTPTSHAWQRESQAVRVPGSADSRQRGFQAARVPRQREPQGSASPRATRAPRQRGLRGNASPGAARGPEQHEAQGSANPGAARIPGQRESRGSANPGVARVGVGGRGGAETSGRIAARPLRRVGEHLSGRARRNADGDQPKEPTTTWTRQALGGSWGWFAPPLHLVRGLVRAAPLRLVRA